MDAIGTEIYVISISLLNDLEFKLDAAEPIGLVLTLFAIAIRLRR